MLNLEGIKWLRVFSSWKIRSSTLVYLCADMGAAFVSSLAQPSLLSSFEVVASLRYEQSHLDEWYLHHPFYFLFLVDFSPP
jgi:hypothetical protein